MRELPAIEAKTVKHYNGDIVVPASARKYGYYFLMREKKGHEWKPIAHVYVAGDVCPAVAEDYFVKYGYIIKDNCRIATDDEFLQFQVTYHLRACGMKRG